MCIRDRPYAIPEGARMHCATISTHVGAVSRIVIDGETGFLVQPGDVEALTERMLRLTRDGALRQRLGQAIFEKVKREFSIDATVRTQVEIYETILRLSLIHIEMCIRDRVCGAVFAVLHVAPGDRYVADAGAAGGLRSESGGTGADGPPDSGPGGRELLPGGGASGAAANGGREIWRIWNCCRGLWRRWCTKMLKTDMPSCG